MTCGNRCAIYARYSSREQDGTSTIESEARECWNLFMAITAKVVER